MKAATATLATFLLLLTSGQEVLPVVTALVGAFDPQVLLRQVAAGFSHIVPDGLDHIAFLLGLFFLTRSFPALLVQVTLFTLAHSLTLGLVVLTGLSLPVRAVEVAVGLSIAAVAFEGMFPTVFWRWRWATLVLFGGIHGLAFAHSMILGSDMALSPLAALFGFNFGVGVGQLLVISAAFLLAAPFWQRAWYRPRVVLPALSLIALVGLGWALARI